MARLTDTQLIILSAASQREDRGVELPANVKGEAARKVVDKLIRAGLLEEVHAGGSLPIWRRDNESGAIALRVTSAGLAAIDATDEATAAPQETREIVLHVALNTWTNYINEVAKTDIDFPVVTARKAA